MKRLILFLTVVTLLTSCTTYSTDTTDAINLTVRAQDWVDYDGTANDIPRYYAYTFSMPEIDYSVYNQGLVQAYVVFNGAQQVLPYVQHYGGSNATSSWVWTRTIDFRYSVGELTVYVTNSDFAVDVPPAMNFRVVIVK